MKNPHRGGEIEKDYLQPSDMRDILHATNTKVTTKRGVRTIDTGVGGNGISVWYLSIRGMEKTGDWSSTRMGVGIKDDRIPRGKGDV